jgi:chromosome segregation ATPase
MIVKHQLEGRLREETSKNSDLNTKIEQLEASVQNASAKMAQYQQTISLLVSEKTTLTASLERLGQLEPSPLFLQVRRYPVS